MGLTRKILSQFTLLALAVFPTEHVNAAEFYVDSSAPSCTLGLHMRGNITAGDKEKFDSIIVANIHKSPANCEKLVVIMSLNSDGGDVHVAIDLGYAIRKAEPHIFVRGNERCLSSCVLLLAAGVQRTVLGEVGVHRPYFSALDTDASLSQIKQKRDATNASIRKYLVDMDVSTALLDMMLMVRPEEIRYLTREQLAQMRLSGIDANWDEMRTAKLASFYGLRSGEYRSRDANAKARCDLAGSSIEDVIRYQACQDAIILGISAAEAQKRRSVMGTRCKQTNYKDRFACMGSVMQGK